MESSRPAILSEIWTRLSSCTSAEQFCEVVEEARKAVSELEDSAQARSMHRHVFQSLVQCGSKWIGLDGPGRESSRLLHLLGHAHMLELVVYTLPYAGSVKNFNYNDDFQQAFNHKSDESC